MDFNKKGFIKKYDRVMPRVYNQSRSSLKSGSFVTRHETPSSVRFGGKTSVSNMSSGIFSDLPTVLNDYKVDSYREVPVKRTSIVKPRRTLKSLDPALSPPPSVPRSQELIRKPCSTRVRGSAPSVLTRREEKCPEPRLRHGYYSKSDTGLKEIKAEIKAYQETEKLMRLRSRLFKSCGVVLDDTGQLAADKAVQVETAETDLLPNTESLELEREPMERPTESVQDIAASFSLLPVGATKSSPPLSPASGAAPPLQIED